ncbi:MAG: phosphoribosyltransferase family protein [Candidatus Aenigmatarchaeota archaeon]
MIFEDRIHAGKLLAKKIKEEKIDFSIVLGILRGGIIVAKEISKEFNKKLLPIIARKLRVPFEEELAFGAICEDVIIFNEDVIRSFGITKEQIEKEIEYQKKIIEERKKVFGNEYTKLKSEKVLLVDDGIATGATVKAAAYYLAKNNEVIIASPVIAYETFLEISKEFKIVAVEIAKYMPAIGMFYKDFKEVKDEEILKIL